MGRLRLISARFTSRSMSSLVVYFIHAIFISIFGRYSLPLDFTIRSVKWQVFYFMRYCFLLGGGSLPPDFTSRGAKSLALCLMRYLQIFARRRLTSARFCQQMNEIPVPCFRTVFTGVFRQILPADKKSLAFFLMQYL